MGWAEEMGVDDVVRLVGIEHVLDNIIILIIKGKPDCATLTEILDRLLYR